jgi:Transposase
MLDRAERELTRIKVRAGRRQLVELLEWANGHEDRTWAVEAAGGMGYLLSQQLVAAGETVLDVPATLASRVRVLNTGQSTKSDPNDAHSVAVAALRAPSLASVQRADHTTVCRLLAKHHNDLGRWRNKLCCRLHALVAELVPGGIDKEVVVNQARSLLAEIEPDDVAAVERHRQAVEFVGEIERIDDLMRNSRERIDTAVEASETTLREIFRRRHDRRLHAHRLQRRPNPVRHGVPLRRLHRHRPDRVLLWRMHRPPAVTARQPATQPRPPHRRDHPDPLRPQPRPTLLRPQARRRQDPTRSGPRIEASAQRRRLAAPRRRRPPRHRLTGGPGRDNSGTSLSPA